MPCSNWHLPVNLKKYLKAECVTVCGVVYAGMVPAAQQAPLSIAISFDDVI